MEASATAPSSALTAQDIAISLADEGVPVRAIARVIRTPGDAVYKFLKTAVDIGRLTELPKDDWPAGTSRTTRSPVYAPLLSLDDDTLRLACAQVFGTTRLQSAVLVAIIRRPETTKENIHQAIEGMRPSGAEPTDQKMVDVVICHIRKKLSPATVELKTLWGIGYSLAPLERDKVLSLLMQHVATKGS